MELKLEDEEVGEADGGGDGGGDGGVSEES